MAAETLNKKLVYMFFDWVGNDFFRYCRAMPCTKIDAIYASVIVRGQGILPLQAVCEYPYGYPHTLLAKCKF